MIKYFIRLFSVALLSVLAFTNIVLAQDTGYEREKVIEGVPATGPNRILDRSNWDFGTVFGWPLGTTSFPEVGEYNPNGPEPLPLTSNTPMSAVLATILDPDFIRATGYDPSNLDPSYVNVPLHQVKTLTEVVNSAGVLETTRKPLTGIFQSAPFSASIAEPDEPITLGKWLGAKGRAFIRCNETGGGSVRLIMKGLLPNRLYSVWGGSISAQHGPFNHALGGAPSAFTTDGKGSASWDRKLNFCPLEASKNPQAQLAWIMVLYHSDHMAYGSVFGPSSDSLFGGSIGHVQIEFDLLGSPVSP